MAAFRRKVLNFFEVTDFLNFIIFGNTSKSLKFFSDRRGAIHRAGWAYYGVCGHIPHEKPEIYVSCVSNFSYYSGCIFERQFIVLLFLTFFCVSISGYDR